MAKSKNGSIFYYTSESGCGHESKIKSPQESGSGEPVSRPEHRRINQTYKKKIPLVKLKEPFRFQDCSRDFKSKFSSSSLSGSTNSQPIRFWLNEFCIEVNNDFNSSTLTQLVKALIRMTGN